MTTSNDDFWKVKKNVPEDSSFVRTASEAVYHAVHGISVDIQTMDIGTDGTLLFKIINVEDWKPFGTMRVQQAQNGCYLIGWEDNYGWTFTNELEKTIREQIKFRLAGKTMEGDNRLGELDIIKDQEHKESNHPELVNNLLELVLTDLALTCDGFISSLPDDPNTRHTTIIKPTPDGYSVGLGILTVEPVNSELVGLCWVDRRSEASGTSSWNDAVDVVKSWIKDTIHNNNADNVKSILDEALEDTEMYCGPGDLDKWYFTINAKESDQCVGSIIIKPLDPPIKYRGELYTHEVKWSDDRAPLCPACDLPTTLKRMLEQRWQRHLYLKSKGDLK